MKRILIFILSLLSISLMAQPLARYNLYPFSENFANPAATGLTKCTEFNATDLHQWLGIKDAPSIQSFSLQKGYQFARNKKHGLGANIVRDANGPSKSLGGEFFYSFHVMVGRIRPSWLSFGLSGNIQQNKLDESGFSPIYDPAISGSVIQEITYNASSGFFVYNDTYFYGLAVYNLLPIKSMQGIGYGNERFFTGIQGGYLFNVRRLPIKLLTSFQGFRGSDIIQLDVTNDILFEKNINLGLTLRKYLGNFQMAGQNAIVFIGYKLNNWGFSYHYNIDINGTQFHHFGTHQISVSYKICPEKYSCPAYK